MSKSKDIELADGAMTPITAAEKAKRLRAAVVGAISEKDVGNVMTTLLIRAKGGDLKAIDMVLKIIGSEQSDQQPVPPPQQIGVQVNVGDTDRSDRVRVGVIENATVPSEEISDGLMLSMRENVARVLGSRGALDESVLADECNIPQNLIGKVVSDDCRWFAKSRLGVVLTVIGRREVLQSK